MRTTILTTTCVAFATAALLSTAGCSDRDDATAQRDTFTTCTDFTNPPFSYIDGGKQAGSDPEIVSALAKQMDADVEMKDTRFSSLIAGLQASRCDAVVSFLYIKPERAKIVDFVGYAQSGSGFLVHEADAYQPNAVQDLCGHRVAVLQGGAQEATALDLAKSCKDHGGPVQVVSLPTDTAAVQDLIAGRVDTFYSDNATVVFRAKEFAKEKLAASNDKPLDPVVAGIAVRKGDKETRVKIESALAAIRVSGKMDEILRSYGLLAVTDADVNRALAGS